MHTGYGPRNERSLWMNVSRPLFLTAALAWLCAGPPASARQYSHLWGRAGEKWSPESRLPDFSFAGYRSGEAPLPSIRSVTSVREHGARGDGRTDDTQAFIRAVDATDRGDILIPRGRYLITDIIRIRKPHIVLRGAGPDKTVIYCPKGLEQVRPNMGKTTSGRPTSNYSWSGGCFWATGGYQSKPLSRITSETRRGARIITLQKASGLAKGRRVVVEVTDDKSRSLLNHLYSGDPGDTRKIRGNVRTSMINRITAIHGNKVYLERPLRFDLRQAWSPTLRAFEPSVSEVGIEDMTFEFPNTPYKGHFTEIGYNAIALYGVSDCWVRNVHVVNCDSGIYASGAFCTLEDIVLRSDRRTSGGTTGHHGITLGTDNLCRNFDFRTHFIHDFTVSNFAAGNVVKNDRGTNLSLDHHKKGPHENLFCNLDLGRGSEMWRCGGGGSLGKHCGARGTFWCIRAERDQAWPPSRFGPDSMNLVGLRTKSPSRKDPDGKWFEAIPPEQLHPKDLHAAQLARRLRQR